MPIKGSYIISMWIIYECVVNMILNSKAPKIIIALGTIFRK